MEWNGVLGGALENGWNEISIYLFSLLDIRLGLKCRARAA